MENDYRGSLPAHPSVSEEDNDRSGNYDINLCHPECFYLAFDTLDDRESVDSQTHVKRQHDDRRDDMNIMNNLDRPSRNTILNNRIENLAHTVENGQRENTTLREDIRNAKHQIQSVERRIDDSVSTKLVFVISCLVAFFLFYISQNKITTEMISEAKKNLTIQETKLINVETRLNHFEDLRESSSPQELREMERELTVFKGMVRRLETDLEFVQRKLSLNSQYEGHKSSQSDVLSLSSIFGAYFNVFISVIICAIFMTLQRSEIGSINQELKSTSVAVEQKTQKDICDIRQEVIKRKEELLAQSNQNVNVFRRLESVEEKMGNEHEISERFMKALKEEVSEVKKKLASLENVENISKRLKSVEEKLEVIKKVKTEFSEVKNKFVSIGDLTNLMERLELTEGKVRRSEEVVTAVKTEVEKFVTLDDMNNVVERLNLAEGKAKRSEDVVTAVKKEVLEIKKKFVSLDHLKKTDDQLDQLVTKMTQVSKELKVVAPELEKMKKDFGVITINVDTLSEEVRLAGNVRSELGTLKQRTTDSVSKLEMIEASLKKIQDDNRYKTKYVGNVKDTFDEVQSFQTTKNSRQRDVPSVDFLVDKYKVNGGAEEKIKKDIENIKFNAPYRRSADVKTFKGPTENDILTLQEEDLADLKRKTQNITTKMVLSDNSIFNLKRDVQSLKERRAVKEKSIVNVILGAVTSFSPGLNKVQTFEKFMFESESFDAKLCIYKAPVTGKYHISGYMCQFGDGVLDLIVMTNGPSLNNRIVRTECNGSWQTGGVVQHLEQFESISLAVQRVSGTATMASCSLYAYLI